MTDLALSASKDWEILVTPVSLGLFVLLCLPKGIDCLSKGMGCLPRDKVCPSKGMDCLAKGIDCPPFSYDVIRLLLTIFAYNLRLKCDVMAKITVQDTSVTVILIEDNDYISLTDMARSQMQEHIIFRWLSLKSTIEYIGEWEMLYNPNFNCTEFGIIKNMAGSNNFVLSALMPIEI